MFVCLLSLIQKATGVNWDQQANLNREMIKCLNFSNKKHVYSWDMQQHLIGNFYLRLLNKFSILFIKL